VNRRQIGMHACMAERMSNVPKNDWYAVPRHAFITQLTRPFLHFSETTWLYCTDFCPLLLYLETRFEICFSIRDAIAMQ